MFFLLCPCFILVCWQSLPVPRAPWLLFSTISIPKVDQQILEAIEQEWLLAIMDCHAQCLQGSIAQILEFLTTTHGYVSVSMLKKKEDELRTLDYHPSQPVDDVIFNIINDW